MQQSLDSMSLNNMMSVNRRRLFQSLALASQYHPVLGGAELASNVDILRCVSAAHGSNLSEDRLRIVEPVIKQRAARVQALRNFEVEESVGLTQGILDR
jgi:hypothetical protein